MFTNRHNEEGCCVQLSQMVSIHEFLILQFYGDTERKKKEGRGGDGDGEKEVEMVSRVQVGVGKMGQRKIGEGLWKNISTKLL